MSKVTSITKFLCLVKALSLAESTLWRPCESAVVAEIFTMFVANNILELAHLLHFIWQNVCIPFRVPKALSRSELLNYPVDIVDMKDSYRNTTLYKSFIIIIIHYTNI